MVGIDAPGHGPDRVIGGSADPHSPDRTRFAAGRPRDRMSSSDPRSVDPSDVEPMGATIAVAFTGAAVGLAGAAISFVAPDLGLTLIGVGVVVALASPLAYVRMKRLRGE